MDAIKTGKLISELRKEQGLTQAELAEKILVSDKAISRWETGRGYPDITNMEALSAALGISVGELLNGEKLDDTVTAVEIRGAERNMMGVLRETARKKNAGYAAAGFLLGLALIILAAVHFMSPRYFTDPREAMSLETLSDGRIIAVLNEDVSGAYVEKVQDQDTGLTQVFISCYRTLWDRIRQKSEDQLIILGGDEIDEVYFYPAADTEAGGDRLLYRRNSLPESNGGVETLPRLVYNYWLLIGFVLSAVGIAAYWFCRKKYYAGTVFRIAALPVSFTLSLLLCLSGSSGAVYDASYYLSGILLLCAVIYAIILLIDAIRRRKKAAAGPQKS